MKYIRKSIKSLDVYLERSIIFLCSQPFGEDYIMGRFREILSRHGQASGKEHELTQSQTGQFLEDEWIGLHTDLTPEMLEFAGPWVLLPYSQAKNILSQQVKAGKIEDTRENILDLCKDIYGDDVGKKLFQAYIKEEHPPFWKPSIIEFFEQLPKLLRDVQQPTTEPQVLYWTDKTGNLLVFQIQKNSKGVKVGPADLGEALIAGERGEELDLSEADFIGANFGARYSSQRSTFGYVKLSKAHLEYAKFNKAAFTTTVYITDAFLFGADFTEAIIKEGIDFSRSDLRNTNFTKAKIGQEAKAEPISFTGADLTGANFTQSIIANAKFINCNLRDAKFSGATIKDVDFTGADLTGADFTGATLEGCTGLSKDMLAAMPILTQPGRGDWVTDDDFVDAQGSILNGGPAVPLIGAYDDPLLPTPIVVKKTFAAPKTSIKAPMPEFIKEKLSKATAGGMTVDFCYSMQNFADLPAQTSHLGIRPHCYVAKSKGGIISRNNINDPWKIKDLAFGTATTRPFALKGAKFCIHEDRLSWEPSSEEDRYIRAILRVPPTTSIQIWYTFEFNGKLVVGCCELFASDVYTKISNRLEAQEKARKSSVNLEALIQEPDLIPKDSLLAQIPAAIYKGPAPSTKPPAPKRTAPFRPTSTNTLIKTMIEFLNSDKIPKKTKKIPIFTAKNLLLVNNLIGDLKKILSSYDGKNESKQREAFIGKIQAFRDGLIKQDSKRTLDALDKWLDSKAGDGKGQFSPEERDSIKHAFKLVEAPPKP